MSIKYNEFGEVISVNGIMTGHHLGTPMQDAQAEKPEHNEVYAEEQETVTRIPNGEEHWDDQPVIQGGGGITPEGTLEIKTNGTHDVANYASADVAIPVGVFPSGELEITENGTFDVTNFASVLANVASSGGGGASNVLVKTVMGGSTSTMTLATAEELASIGFDINKKCFAMLVSLKKFENKDSNTAKMLVLTMGTNWTTYNVYDGFSEFTTSTGGMDMSYTLNGLTTASSTTPYYADGEMKIDYSSYYKTGNWEYLFVVGCY